MAAVSTSGHKVQKAGIKAGQLPVGTDVLLAVDSGKPAIRCGLGLILRPEIPRIASISRRMPTTAASPAVHT